ncbi:MAG: hypothetical protein CL506_03285 [Actinobacteria bacterium]|jgi:RimJ/RimL family protein N-acetyltransferase|nr:hypothetical protein [Actinomycetota bacterium]|tara:strand:- start:647 stop:1183 length:537 start_codon:yes stop_codon:yes gene_type:complete
MTNPAQKVILRPLEENDITDRYISWFADKEVTRFLESRNITKEDSIKNLRMGIKTGLYHMYAICLAKNGLHVGNIKIGPIRPKEGISDLVTLIGDKTIWGQGIGRAAIRLAKDMAFNQYGIRKLVASINSLNTKSVDSYVSAGFNIEAVISKFYNNSFDGKNSFSDKVFVSCENPKFK